MSTPMRTVVALIALAIAALCGEAALAQSEPAARQRADAAASQEKPEEVVVRGRRVGELRAEVEDARQRAYELFNGLNNNDDFDVYCHKESRSGTNVPQVICRAQFENRISADAAGEYLSGLFSACNQEEGGVTQDCMFSNAGAAGINRAQGVEGQLPGKREQMTDEIFRLARENDEFAKAILDWYEASRQYDEARKRRNDR
jgi:hypothetical protein